jgi:hypothetical protein|tara:strand:+ start:91970 stop:92308 length:339 start_codon:yes stop_codon:yes gene_type:complete
MFFKRIFSVFSILFFITACSKPKHNFYVHSKDSETIDSLQIFVGHETYLIEDLQPSKTKSIKVYRLGGNKISLQADTRKTMALSTVLDPSFRGTLKLIITKERILSSGTYTN